MNREIAYQLDLLLAFMTASYYEKIPILRIEKNISMQVMNKLVETYNGIIQRQDSLTIPIKKEVRQFTAVLLLKMMHYWAMVIHVYGLGDFILYN